MRGIGTGGFGEVYFAVTDGGKEVALEADSSAIKHIELRGMAQCLNLKHPNLVHLYDLGRRTAAITGSSWNTSPANRCTSSSDGIPQGLSADLIRPWFGQLAARRGICCTNTASSIAI